jgi:hypothetical protein
LYPISGAGRKIGPRRLPSGATPGSDQNSPSDFANLPAKLSPMIHLHSNAAGDGLLYDYVCLCIKTAGQFRSQIAVACDLYVPGEWQRAGLMKIVATISDLARFGGTPAMADALAMLPLPSNRIELMQLDGKIADIQQRG